MRTCADIRAHLLTDARRQSHAKKHSQQNQHHTSDSAPNTLTFCKGIKKSQKNYTQNHHTTERNVRLIRSRRRSRRRVLQNPYCPIGASWGRTVEAILKNFGEDPERGDPNQGQRFEGEGGGYNQVPATRSSMGPVGRRWHASMCVRRRPGSRWSGSPDRQAGTMTGPARRDRPRSGPTWGKFDTLCIMRHRQARNARNQRLSGGP